MFNNSKYKYLKYKKKYLKLKYFQKGGNKPNIMYLKNINLFSSNFQNNYFQNTLFNNYKKNMEKYLDPIMGCIWSINAIENIYRYEDDTDESTLIRKLFMENAGDISVSKIYSYGDNQLNCRDIGFFLAYNYFINIYEVIDDYNNFLQKNNHIQFKLKTLDSIQNILKKYLIKGVYTIPSIKDINEIKLFNRNIKLNIKNELKTVNDWKDLMADIKKLKNQSSLIIKDNLDKIVYNENKKIRTLNRLFNKLQIKDLKNENIYYIFLTFSWMIAQNKSGIKDYYNGINDFIKLINNITEINGYKLEGIEIPENWENQKFSMNEFEDSFEHNLYSQILKNDNSIPFQSQKWPYVTDITDKNCHAWNFPDCGITSLRNFIQILIYDTLKDKFNLEILDIIGATKDVKDFFELYEVPYQNLDRKNTKFNKIEKGVTKEFKDMNLTAREAWALITCDQKNVKYLKNNCSKSCEIDSGLINEKLNILILINNLFTKINEWIDFNKLLKDYYQINFIENIGELNISIKRDNSKIELRWILNKNHYQIDVTKKEVKSSSSYKYYKTKEQGFYLATIPINFNYYKVAESLKKNKYSKYYWFYYLKTKERRIKFINYVTLSKKDYMNFFKKGIIQKEQVNQPNMSEEEKEKALDRLYKQLNIEEYRRIFFNFNIFDNIDELKEFLKEVKHTNNFGFIDKNTLKLNYDLHLETLDLVKRIQKFNNLFDDVKDLEIYINNDDLMSKDKKEFDIFFWIRNFSKIKKLKVNCTYFKLTDFTKYFPDLEELIIPMITREYTFMPNKLKKLVLSHRKQYFEKYKINTTNLDNLEYFSALDSDIEFNMVKNMKNLKYLEMNSLTIYVNKKLEFLSPISEFNTRLEYLKIYQLIFHNYNKPGIYRDVLFNQPNLRVLKIMKLHARSTSQWKKDTLLLKNNLSNLKNLQELILPEIYMDIDENLLKNFKNLQILHLQDDGNTLIKLKESFYYIDTIINLKIIIDFGRDRRLIGPYNYEKERYDKNHIIAQVFRKPNQRNSLGVELNNNIRKYLLKFIDDMKLDITKLPNIGFEYAAIVILQYNLPEPWRVAIDHGKVDTDEDLLETLIKVEKENGTSLTNKQIENEKEDIKTMRDLQKKLFKNRLSKIAQKIYYYKKDPYVRTYIRPTE